MDSLNSEKSVYIISRPGIDEQATRNDLKLLDDIDLSLHSMRTFVLNIKSSYLFKLFIASINGVSLWSVGKRFSPYEKLEVESNHEDDMKQISEGCNKVWNKYKNNRILYKNLPANLLVNYIISLDERTLNSIIFTIDSEYPIYKNYSVMLRKILGKKPYKSKSLAKLYGFDDKNKHQFDGPIYEYPLQQSEVKTIEYSIPLLDLESVINHPHVLIHNDIYSAKFYYYNEAYNHRYISLGGVVKGTFTGDPDIIDSIKLDLLKKYSYDNLKFV